MEANQTRDDAAYQAALDAAAVAYDKHPKAASWAYDDVVLDALKEHYPEAGREDYVRWCKRAHAERAATGSPAAWAVGAVCDSTVAWLTPGFGEAMRYNRLYGS